MTTDLARPKLSPLRVDVRRLLIRAVVLPLSLMAIVAVALAVQVGRLSEASGTVARAALVIAQANDVQKEMLDQETGLRAYLLTENRTFLQPFNRAQPEQALDALTRLVERDPGQAAAVAAARDRFRDWHLRAVRAVHDPSGSRSSAAMLARKAEMDGIRSVLAGIADAEEARRIALARAARGETEITTAGSVAVLVALGGTLAGLTRRAIRRVAGAYEEALAQSAASEAAQALLADGERDARKKALDALRLKDEFLSTLSHELRTPLTAILGWAGVLRHQRAPDTVARALSAIDRNARVQAQIVDDILDVSRIVAGKFELRLAPTDLGAVVRAALAVVHFSAESKGVTVQARLDAEPIHLVADPDRLQQVVWNLLSNAIKFTPRHGRVEVRAMRREGRVILEVRDDGEGIPAEFLPHVFERFRQADSSCRRAHGGLGLGLAIVRHLVELHGGEVLAESEGPGRGAVFTVSLPEVAAEAPTASPSPHPGPAVDGELRP